ncbi:uncharacterized protein LOC113359937 [Papaver somniferum]|uniref:uncharacterized protein LOC113359937 n=1 Tax=Papaver somniferum TaxID=3469 RepID=UPI000E6FA14C|nr:uncharacterized protein LOC113359937 [Papaver somniferum]
MAKLISPQQSAYIKGRSIQDQIMLASEMVNEMKKTRRGSNVGVKLDISQAYDSVSWEFLLQVLSRYGFSNRWCQWLKILFESARISVSINGGPHGFFSVGRGLRQGDPLSPTLFVLMEDVLSRCILKMVQEKLISPMVIRKGIHPTHLFFVDDVFLFCNGAKKSVEHLAKLLEDYQRGSGQRINKAKSKLFIDGTTSLRKQLIKEILHMEINTFPDKYLGVILAPGKVKISSVWPMVELMQKKLAAWKGRLLSFQDRLVLIKIINSKEDWAMFIKANFTNRKGQWSDDWKKSTIWSGLKWAWNNNLHMKVANLIYNNRWEVPMETQQLLNAKNLPELGIGHDQLIWTGNLQGVFVDDTVMVKRGYELASRCCVCEESQDSMNHLLWHCSFSVEIWSWLRSIFEVGLPHSFDNIWNYSKNKSPLMKEVWITAACYIIKELWFQKNKKYFEEVKPNIQHFKQKIIKIVSEGGLRMKGTKWNQNYDLQIIDFFNLGCRQRKFQCIKSFYWIPPQIGFTLFYCDGASVGNLGAAGFGIVVRNHLY